MLHEIVFYRFRDSDEVSCPSNAGAFAKAFNRRNRSLIDRIETESGSARVKGRIQPTRVHKVKKVQVMGRVERVPIGNNHRVRLASGTDA